MAACIGGNDRRRRFHGCGGGHLRRSASLCNGIRNGAPIPALGWDRETRGTNQKGTENEDCCVHGTGARAVYCSASVARECQLGAAARSSNGPAIPAALRCLLAYSTLSVRDLSATGFGRPAGEIQKDSREIRSK